MLTLTRGDIVAGEVLDAASKPAPKARVLLGEKFTRQPRIQPTDENGRFRFEHRIHERSVTVQAPGSRPKFSSSAGGKRFTTSPSGYRRAES